MSFDELALTHMDGDSPRYHAEISIQYAISVLEELRVPLTGAMFPDYHNLPVAIETKIEELKKLVE